MGQSGLLHASSCGHAFGLAFPGTHTEFESSTGLTSAMRNKALSTLAPSLQSAFVGWAAGIIAAAFGMAFAGGNPFAFALLVGIFSAPVILVVCLLLLWPLYAFVPGSSPLWRTPLCVLCGVLAGGLLEVGLTGQWERGDIWLVFLGSLVGGVSCFVGSQLNTREPGYVEPLPRPPFHSPIFSVGRWLTTRIAEWSGQ